jgi:hypothetical protein
VLSRSIKRNELKTAISRRTCGFQGLSPATLFTSWKQSLERCQPRAELMTGVREIGPSNCGGDAAHTMKQLRTAPDLRSMEFGGGDRDAAGKGDGEGLAVRTLDSCRWLAPQAFVR